MEKNVFPMQSGKCPKLAVNLVFSVKMRIIAGGS